MGNFLQQLQNNEAVLLMYLADELPAEDRAEVEQMLINDAKLRAELVQIREAQTAVELGLANLDQSAPVPLSVETAVRQVSRMLRQRQLDKLNSRPPALVHEKRNIPRWAYWGASVAAAVIGTVVVWGMKPAIYHHDSLAATNPSDDGLQEAHLDPSQQEEQARLLDITLQSGDALGQIAKVENEASGVTGTEESDQALSLSLLGMDEQGPQTN